MSLTRTLVGLVTLALLLPAAGAASDDTPSIAEAIEAYAAIGSSLAADSAEGIAENVAVLQDYAKNHEPLLEPVQALSAEGADLPALRAAYKSFSGPFLDIAKADYSPNGDDHDWTIVHCSMAKGSWIQTDGPVTNPYYGSKMLRCGKKVGGLGEETPSPSSETGHGEHGEGMHSDSHSSGH